MNKRYLYEIIFAIAGVIALIAVFIIFTPKKDKYDLEGRNLWHKQCEKFYQSAAETIIQLAEHKGAKVIMLTAEENNSDYICSSPCNEGMVKALERNLVISRVVYLKTRIFDNNKFSHWLSVLLSKWTSEKCGRQLKDGKWEKMLPSEIEDAEKDNHINVHVRVQEITLDKKNNSCRAVFALIVNGRDVFSEKYDGDATQIRWFLRKGYPLWSVIIVFVFFVIWAILYIYYGQKDQDVGLGEAQLAAGCIFIGLLSCFVLIFCNPFRREEACYSKPANVLFLIDKNSEIFFEPSNNGEVPPPYVIERTCENIKQLLSKPRLPEQASFFRWLSNYAFVSIYTKERFLLNREGEYPVFAFSGLRKEETIVPTTIESATSIDSIIRESRLFIPQLELELEGHIDNFACLFTSACAPCKEDVRGYFNNASTLLRKRDTSNLSVFTVFFPTIPRTGAKHQYDYEDGKLALASLVSDKIISLNNLNYDIKKALKSIEVELEESLGINYEQIPSPQITDIFYNINNLGFDYHKEWDKPLDLAAIRSLQLSINREKVEEGSKQIAEEFKNFIKEERKDTQEEKRDIVHVLQSEPFGIWVIIILSSLSGFRLFTKTRNDVYLHYFGTVDNVHNDTLVRLFDYLEPLLSLIIFLLGFFILQWRCSNPLVWTSLGYSDAAFIAGMLLWICCFCVPFLVFRVWRNGTKLEIAKGLWGSIAIIFVIGLICVFYFSYQKGLIERELYSLSFFITLVIAFLPLLIWLKRGEESPLSSHDDLTRWRRPWWIFIIKTIFLFCFVIAVRGVFRADLSYYLSYPHLVFFCLPISLCLLGLLVLLASQRPRLPTIISFVTLLSTISILVMVGG